MAAMQSVVSELTRLPESNDFHIKCTTSADPLIVPSAQKLPVFLIVFIFHMLHRMRAETVLRRVHILDALILSRHFAA